MNEFNMICGGSPCFEAGSMVLTPDGYVPIEKIHEGDSVYTHTKSFQNVLRCGSNSDKEIYELIAQGIPPTYATGNHPYFAKKRNRIIHHDYIEYSFDEPDYIPVSSLTKDHYIAFPINGNHADLSLTDEELWLFGRYVADGHIRYAKRKHRKDSYQYQFFLSVGNSKIDEVKSNVKEHHYSCYKHTQSVYRFCISSKDLVEKVIQLGFGNSASNKCIPQCILDLPSERLKIFLDGYLSGDGCTIESLKLVKATTISKKLALCLCQAIVKVYGVGCNIYYAEKPDKHEICGRIVNQNNSYNITFHPDSDRKHTWHIADGYVWYPVRSIRNTGRKETVYNLEVESDHTYCVNNAIVHNCQDFSVAGKQEGSRWQCNHCHKSWNPLTVHFDKRDFCPYCSSNDLDKTRSSLLVEWLRIIRANKPKWAIYENVKALTSKKFKETFQMFLDELSEYGYNTYWQVLNAKDFGIPQNRERVYVIIVRKDLDNGKFQFPEPFESDIVLKDVLEDQVDESYYVNTPRAQKLIEDLVASGKLTKQTSNTVRGGQRQCRKSLSVGCDSDKVVGLFANKCGRVQRRI